MYEVYELIDCTNKFDQIKSNTKSDRKLQEISMKK